MKNVLFICLLIMISSCEKNRELVVVNSHNKAKFSQIKKLELDKHYKNLLSLQHSTQEEYKEVVKTWQSFHKQIGKIVKENNFDWEVQDSSVLVFNRVYFIKNGEIDYYTFKIVNENVSNAKKDEYEKLLSENISEVKINLNRDTQYAQCGKVKYKNK